MTSYAIITIVYWWGAFQKSRLRIHKGIIAHISPKVFTSPVTVSLWQKPYTALLRLINTRAKVSGFVMNLERFSIEFALLSVTHKIRIRCKRFSDTSQIQSVWNPESKVQNLYMKPLVVVDESTIGQFLNGPNRRRTYDLLSPIPMLCQWAIGDSCGYNLVPSFSFRRPRRKQEETRWEQGCREEGQ